VLLLFSRVISVDICIWLVDYDSLLLLEGEALVMLAITGEVIPSVPNNT
jgi:hypothetical protein